MPATFTAETASKGGAEGQAKSARKWESSDSGTLTSFQMRKLKPKFCSATATYVFDLFPHVLSSNNRKKETDTQKSSSTKFILFQLDPIWVFPHSLTKSELVWASRSCLKYRNRWAQVDMSQMLRISGI